ncbi:unnamed protein product [Scytosiphon promiscuus]
MQLSWSSLQWTLWAIAAVMLWYFTYGLKHSVGQKSRTWPHLAATSAQAASEPIPGIFGYDDPADSVGSASPRFLTPSSSPSIPRRTFGNKRKGGSRRERSNLRATFPGEPPLEDASPNGGGGGGLGGSGRDNTRTGGGVAGRQHTSGGGEGEGLAPVAQQEEGYMSFAALRFPEGT